MNTEPLATEPAPGVPSAYLQGQAAATRIDPAMTALYTDLGDNAALSGSVLWRGRLLGLTPHAETVAGAAELTVDLPTLSGSLNLTGLEQWSANAAPGTVGSGAAWRDGRLSYRVAVRGNTFVQTGGGPGLVTGAFFGPLHEGMGGVLVRDDLSAGFGGKR